MKVVTDQQKDSQDADVQESTLCFKQHLMLHIQDFQPHLQRHL